MPDIFERLALKTTLGPPSIYRVQVTRSHLPFHRAICRRLSSSKDMIILALVSDKVTTSDDKTESQFQDDATDTITRREMDWPTSSEGRNASARKVTMIIQTGTLEMKKKRVDSLTRLDIDIEAQSYRIRVRIANWTQL